MNESDLDKMESVLGIKLPPVYRSWVLALPTSADEEHWQSGFSDAEVLIETNQHFREHGFCGAHWPPNLICIGDYLGNVYTFFDSANPSAGVFSAHVGCEPFYMPDDYADCYQGSLEDFCKLSPTPNQTLQPTARGVERPGKKFTLHRLVRWLSLGR